jgi:hypothetical protein
MSLGSVGLDKIPQLKDYWKISMITLKITFIGSYERVLTFDIPSMEELAILASAPNNLIVSEEGLVVNFDNILHYETV